MITFIPPRLRKPAMYGLAGMLFAAAWLIRGGPLSATDTYLAWETSASPKRAHPTMRTPLLRRTTRSTPDLPGTRTATPLPQPQDGLLDLALPC
jgi:hypothetical protein